MSKTIECGDVISLYGSSEKWFISEITHSGRYGTIKISRIVESRYGKKKRRKKNVKRQGDR